MGIPITAVVHLLAATMATSPVDSAGNFTVEFDPGPIAIYAADRYKTWDHSIPVPMGVVCEVRSFVGWDRGSLGEASLELNLAGYRLYERSEHKEADLVYDAWKTREVAATLDRATILHMATGAVQTGPNTHDKGLSTRVHFAVRLRMHTSSCGGR